MKLRCSGISRARRGGPALPRTSPPSCSATLEMGDKIMPCPRASAEHPPRPRSRADREGLVFDPDRVRRSPREECDRTLSSDRAASFQLRKHLPASTGTSTPLPPPCS